MILGRGPERAGPWISRRETKNLAFVLPKTRISGQNKFPKGKAGDKYSH